MTLVVTHLISRLEKLPNSGAAGGGEAVIVLLWRTFLLQVFTSFSVKAHFYITIYFGTEINKTIYVKYKECVCIPFANIQILRISILRSFFIHL